MGLTGAPAGLWVLGASGGVGAADAGGKEV